MTQNTQSELEAAEEVAANGTELVDTGGFSQTDGFAEEHHVSLVEITWRGKARSKGMREVEEGAFDGFWSSLPEGHGNPVSGRGCICTQDGFQKLFVCDGQVKIVWESVRKTVQKIPGPFSLDTFRLQNWVPVVVEGSGRGRGSRW